MTSRAFIAGCLGTSLTPDERAFFRDARQDVPHSPNITHTLRSHNTPQFFEGRANAKELEEQVTRYSISDSSIYQNSHFGYVYCLLLGKVPNVEGESCSRP